MRFGAAGFFFHYILNCNSDILSSQVLILEKLFKVINISYCVAANA